VPAVPAQASDVAAPSVSPPDALSGNGLDAIKQALAKMGCPASSLVARADRYYAACGESGVWILSLTSLGELRLEAKHRVAGKVRSLFVQSDEVWVAFTQDSAQPLRDTALEALVVTSESGPVQGSVAVQTPSSEGVVLSARDQQVTISIGKKDGLKLGERVEVYTTRTNTVDDGLGSEATREETVLVGTITALSESRSRIAAGLGEMAAEGMKARPTSRPRSANRLAPERIGSQLLVEGSVRPFLPVDKLAFAAQADASATYLPAFDAYASVDFRPLGLLVGKNNSPSYAGAYASAGYDQTYFSLGLGVGVLHSQHEIEDGSPPIFVDQTQFSVLQQVRLGARDGLHFAASTAVKLRGDSWEFGWFEGLVQFPLGSRTWGVLRGSGSSEPSYFFTEFGFRRLVRGNGGPGSLFLRPTAGVAGIVSQSSEWGDLAIGPLIGLHVEGRFGG